MYFKDYIEPQNYTSREKLQEDFYQIMNPNSFPLVKKNCSPSLENAVHLSSEKNLPLSPNDTLPLSTERNSPRSLDNDLLSTSEIVNDELLLSTNKNLPTSLNDTSFHSIVKESSFLQKQPLISREDIPPMKNIPRPIKNMPSSINRDENNNNNNYFINHSKAMDYFSDKSGGETFQDKKLSHINIEDIIKDEKRKLIFKKIITHKTKNMNAFKKNCFLMDIITQRIEEMDGFIQNNFQSTEMDLPLNDNKNGKKEILILIENQKNSNNNSSFNKTKDINTISKFNIDYKYDKYDILNNIEYDSVKKSNKYHEIRRNIYKNDTVTNQNKSINKNKSNQI